MITDTDKKWAKREADKMSAAFDDLMIKQIYELPEEQRLLAYTIVRLLKTWLIRNDCLYLRVLSRVIKEVVNND